ncbi:MAG: ABC transporter permease, partial [Clostridia bacterium]|nr:ABC transporter permease [Clostridia bacterium]
RTAQLAVRARYELPLGERLACTAPGCPPPGRLGPTYVQPTRPTRDVFVPWSEWLALWRQAAGPEVPAAREWAVRLGDPGRARDFAALVRATGFGTAATVHDLWASATARATFVTPDEARDLAAQGEPVGRVTAQGEGGAGQPGAPTGGLGPSAGAGGGLPPVVWHAVGPAHLALPSPWLGWLSILLASLILGGQMVALVGRRRKELGVLLALGASPAAVVGLVAAEALAYAVLGSLVGFLAMTLLTLPSTAYGASAAGWLARAALRFGEVLLAAAGLALVAAIAPAGLAAATRVTEVIRDG